MIPSKIRRNREKQPEKRRKTANFTAPSAPAFQAYASRRSMTAQNRRFLRVSSYDRPLKEVLLDAGATRFKPILLTAVAAMIGAAVILTDPIFQGLAISLLFGLLSSTLLTVLVIPAIYVVMSKPQEKGRT